MGLYLPALLWNVFVPWVENPLPKWLPIKGDSKYTYISRYPNTLIGMVKRSHLIFSVFWQPTWSLAVLGAVSISLSVIAVILTCCNWLVVHWVFTQKCKDIICNRRIFQNDVVVKIATAYLISFFGLLLMVLVALVLALPICQIRQDERLWDTVYFGWVRIMY